MSSPTEWYRANPERMVSYYTKYRNGISVRDKYKLFKSQNFACAICRTHDFGKRGPHIDHDHKCCSAKSRQTCGKCVRGILCSSCNLILGHAKDNLTTLKQAITYLERK